MRNVAASCGAALSAGAEALGLRTQVLLQDLACTRAAFEEVTAEADGVVAEVRVWGGVGVGRVMSFFCGGPLSALSLFCFTPHPCASH